MNFVTKDELNAMLYEQSQTITEVIQKLVSERNRELSECLRKELLVNPKYIPQLPKDNSALRSSLYKYLFHSDQARICFIHELASLNNDRKIILRIDDINAITSIEISEVMGGLVSILRVILRYTLPSYLSMVKDKSSRWNRRQSDDRKEFIEYLRNTITVAGKIIDRDNFYNDFKYALAKENISPMTFSLE